MFYTVNQSIYILFQQLKQVYLIFSVRALRDVGEGQVEGVVLPNLERENGALEVGSPPVPAFYTEKKSITF